MLDLKYDERTIRLILRNKSIFLKRLLKRNHRDLSVKQNLYYTATSGKNIAYTKDMTEHALLFYKQISELRNNISAIEVRIRAIKLCINSWQITNHVDGRIADFKYHELLDKVLTDNFDDSIADSINFRFGRRMRLHGGFIALDKVVFIKDHKVNNESIKKGSMYNIVNGNKVLLDDLNLTIPLMPLINKNKVILE